VHARFPPVTDVPSTVAAPANALPVWCGPIVVRQCAVHYRVGQRREVNPSSYTATEGRSLAGSNGCVRSLSHVQPNDRRRPTETGDVIDGRYMSRPGDIGGGGPNTIVSTRQRGTKVVGDWITFFDSDEASDFIANYCFCFSSLSLLCVLFI